MKRIEITDNMMLNFLRLSENPDNILGEGSQRTALAYSNDLVIKMNYKRYNKTCLERMLLDTRCKRDDDIISIVDDYKYMYAIYSSEQSIREIDILLNVDYSRLWEYLPEIKHYGMWNNSMITICERLKPIPCLDNWDCKYDFEDVAADIEELLKQMENDLYDIPLRITDIFEENFGYDKNGNLKCLDLGWWQYAGEHLQIDWPGFWCWYDEYKPNDERECDCNECCICSDCDACGICSKKIEEAA